MRLNRYPKTQSFSKVFQWAAVLSLLGAIYALGSCQPLPRAQTPTAKAGTYMVSEGKLFLSDDVFDLKYQAVYPQPKQDGLTNPTIYGITDRELTMYRCTWCHECGFKQAWDWDHYGSKDWKPRYRGDQWQPVVERMMKMENALLNEEQIVRRIYKYLYDDSLGKYNEGQDTKGAVEVEVDKDKAATQKPAAEGTEKAGEKASQAGAQPSPTQDSGSHSGAAETTA